MIMTMEDQMIAHPTITHFQTVAIVTAALLHGGLLTRVKLNELHELFDEKSRFNVSHR